jgi:hypothetical protein
MTTTSTCVHCRQRWIAFIVFAKMTSTPFSEIEYIFLLEGSFWFGVLSLDGAAQLITIQHMFW